MNGNTVWARLTPYHAYRVRPMGAVPMGDDPMPSIERSAGPSLADADNAPLWSPDNPMFWFGALLLVTVGAAAASTQWRLGPLRASVAVGKTK